MTTIRHEPPTLRKLPRRERTAAGNLQGWLHEATQESRDHKRSNRCNALSRPVLRAVQLVVALKIEPELG